MRKKEHDEQSAVIDWCKRMKGMYPELDLIFSIPNGAVVPNYALVQKLKSEGLRAGVPDLCLPVPSRHYHGLFLEMKMPGGVVSKEQRDFIAHVQLLGYKVVICRSTEEAISTLEDYCDGRHQT